VTSQTSTAGRQTVDVEANPSAGQVVLAPSQVSTTSHTPEAARQTAPELPAGCWQVLRDPSHASRGQRLPSLAHARPAAFLSWAGQVAPPPVQFSASSHSPAAVRHGVVDGWNTSAGQLALAPLQFSATSHTPATGRHTVLLDAKPSAGQ